VPFAIERAESLPEIFQALRGLVFVLKADHDVVAIAPAADVSSCASTAPLGGP
jgi:hypothetical protein